MAKTEKIAVLGAGGKDRALARSTRRVVPSPLDVFAQRFPVQRESPLEVRP
jgi:hypothetical protein